ncbi:acyltransferase family protein [Arthrobacter sp. 35W]|uniref:acyltransferase family protein n=1 Tax=Arthrobacter sp. 35W TaxID=1132441 RepID=UPI000686DCBE|nr:acyltransferase [Arthrobacter sp. 35W]
MPSILDTQTFTEFKRARYFPALDGLRAVSILLVLVFHTHDRLWDPLNGYLGVTIFFVISGFLITTLLLREEERDGRASIWRFYVRRAFRIFPLYYLSLIAVSVLVLGFGMGSHPENYPGRLPLLATYNGEFAGSGTFSHSWSLGIEEKFYLVWPFLGFALAAFMRKRLLIASVLLVSSMASTPFVGWNYFAIYIPILAGVVLAILMNQEKTFNIVRQLARPVPGTLILAGTTAALLMNDDVTYVHVPFSILAALSLPLALIGPRFIGNALSWKPLRYVGTRAYGIYLFHPMLLDIVDRVLPMNEDYPLLSLARVVLLLGSSLAVAEVLFRLFENPLIKVGRRLTKKEPARRRSDTVGVSA